MGLVCDFVFMLLIFFIVVYVWMYFKRNKKCNNIIYVINYEIYIFFKGILFVNLLF